MTSPIKTFFFLAASTLLISCASTDKQNTLANSPISITSKSQSPAELERLGQFTEAAKRYITLSRKAAAPEKYALKLKGIDLFIKDNAFEISNNLLLEIDMAELNKNQNVQYAYLKATISLISRNAEKSLYWLKRFQNENYLSFTDEKTALSLIVAIYELANNNQAVTFTRIKLESFISNDSEVLANQQAIIRGFLSLTEGELQYSDSHKPSANEIIWRELSALVNASKNPFRLGSQLAAWKALNPDIHVRDEIISALAPQKNEEQQTIKSIALLLPLSGVFQKPAAAIRDGFLANYYSSNTENRPTIRVYDTNEKDTTPQGIYQRAINEGADIIVGPLRKEAIETLTTLDVVRTPTLVLNQLDNAEFYAENFYQFALSPEREAEQAAQRAWHDGHTRAAIIYPGNSWGNRVSSAFKKMWIELGGDIVTEEDYEAKKNDFSVPLKALLAIDKSNERKQALKKLFRKSLTFEPRRRQDIDFIFMAAFPRQARLIPPQLKFFHAGRLPIYATSHSFSGMINRKKDRDLNRLMIGDMPWTLTKTKNNNTKQKIHQMWPNESQKFNRLYAFGSDAYYVLNYLNWLRSNSLSQLDGATGKLHMNETNQILRELTWAKFKNGSPRLLPASIKRRELP